MPVKAAQSKVEGDTKLSSDGEVVYVGEDRRDENSSNNQDQQSNIDETVAVSKALNCKTSTPMKKTRTCNRKTLS